MAERDDDIRQLLRTRHFFVLARGSRGWWATWRTVVSDP